MTFLSASCYCLLVSIASFHTAEADITVQPWCINVFGTKFYRLLNIVCVPPKDAQTEELSELTIRKELPANNDHVSQEDLASAELGKQNGAVRDLSGLSGTTVSGSVQERGITFNVLLSDPCQDPGTYTCTIGYSNGTEPALLSRNTHAVHVYPGDFMITSTSETKEGVLSAGAKLKLRCEGLIGGDDDGAKVTWKWQYEICGGGAFKDYETQSDIVNDPSEQDPHFPCHRRQVSRLTRTLTPDDQGRKYRCLVSRDGIDFVDQAAYYTVGDVTFSAASLPDDGDGLTTVQKTAIGVGSFGFLLMSGLVILCWRRVRRRR